MGERESCRIGAQGEPLALKAITASSRMLISGDCLQQVADLLGADPKDIIFTSGATESNNMAIKGIARFYKGKRRHMSVAFLRVHGFEVASYLFRMALTSCGAHPASLPRPSTNACSTRAAFSKTKVSTSPTFRFSRTGSSTSSSWRRVFGQTRSSFRCVSKVGDERDVS